MRRLLRSSATVLGVLTLSVGQMLSLAAEDDEAAAVETRAYVLGGYIPKFYRVPRQSDPFDVTEIEEHEEKLREYEQGIVSYLKLNGIEARKIEFKPQ